jgi:hypothetical protein
MDDRRDSPRVPLEIRIHRAQGEDAFRAADGLSPPGLVSGDVCVCISLCS